MAKHRKCPCGSGWSARDCCGDGSNPKKRGYIIRSDKPVEFDGCHISSNGEMKLTLNGRPVESEVSSTLVVTQERANPQKPAKAVVHMPTIEVNKASSPNLDIMRYEEIWCIDTNVGEVSGKKICVSGLAKCTPVVKYDNPKAPTVAFHQKVFSDAFDYVDKFENYAWHKLICCIKQAQRGKAVRTAIIVDSDLGKLDAYNKQSKPYYLNNYLPENITLIYASSDVGKSSFVLNAAIAYCDKAAKKILKEMAN